MTRSSIIFFVFLILVLVVFAFQPEPGEVSIDPDWGIAGEFGTWTVSYRAGSQGISEGGGIRVQLPDTWHAGDRNSANRLQATAPAGDHYISARASRSEVKLRTIVESQSDDLLVKSGRPGLDGRLERYVYVVHVEVLEGNLKAGDTLSVIYGDTSQGSRGMRASVIATDPEPVLLAVDATGSGQYQLQSGRPVIHARSGPPAELLLYGPSSLVVGQPAQLRLALVDANANPVGSFQGQVELRVIQGEADVSEQVRIDLEAGGAAVPFTPAGAGILRLEASALGGILNAVSNPMKVESREPESKIYWGDLHSHTRYSWDGVGDASFDYARYVAGLDFYAMTDHSRTTQDGMTQGLGPHVWEEYTALTEKFNDPGRFVTLHAYEASFGNPYGHHNVFFRGAPGVLLAPGEVTLPQLWEALTAGEALTIPHHTGKMPGALNWDSHDPEIRRNFEIYSAHGLSEAYDPEHPLAFEQSDFTSPARSVKGAQFAQDAWIRGLVLSTIAASDDHRAQPGQPHWGLAAVQATGLTRSEIFDALHARRTYGTTGARILLDFSINGQPMGRQVTVSGDAQLQIEAHGTDLIELLEVLRYSKTDGAFKVIASIQPQALDFVWGDMDRGLREDSIYYVRLRQKGLVRNRIAMAWSSPIWVRVGASADR
ncbi:MAG: DUF3604 domain-containing protein [Acidobacteriota bacterium]